jgi:hypothetical protein
MNFIYRIPLNSKSITTKGPQQELVQNQPGMSSIKIEQTHRIAIFLDYCLFLLCDTSTFKQESYQQYQVPAQILYGNSLDDYQL